MFSGLVQAIEGIFWSANFVHYSINLHQTRHAAVCCYNMQFNCMVKLVTEGAIQLFDYYALNVPELTQL